jgi:2'-5' RNA ligase
MRLFTAIDFPKEVNDYLFFLQSFFSGFPAIHPVNSFHLTLKFFGEAEPEAIIEKLSSAKEKQFELKLTNMGLFPNEKTPRIIWAGVNKEQKLMDLQKNIDLLFKEMKPDFDFHPHITLARCNSKIVLPSIDIKQLSFDVNEFKLYQSIIKKEGIEYKKLKSFSLQDL